jgi:signal transduction histidine kinase
MAIVIASITTISWIVIEMMVAINPSQTIPLGGDAVRVAVYFSVSAIAMFAMPIVAVRTREKRLFTWAFICGFVGLVGIAWYGGAFLHRDFFAFLSPLIMVYLAIFLYRVDDLSIVRRRQVYRYLTTATLVIFSLWIVWLMVMAYSIVVRTEPRWIESTAYNVMNGIIGLLLLYVAMMLRERTRRTISNSKGEWYLDDRNVSVLLSPQENAIIDAFFDAPHNVVSCSQLVATLHPAAEVEKRPREECERCRLKQWTASECKSYRNIKNRIAATKKYLELLQIGTIVPNTENAREIKEKGWRLRLFDDVRYISK